MYSSIFVTAPDIETARVIGRTIVQERLAACANYWPIGSIYRWKGELSEEDECAIVFKVKDADLELFRERMVEIHPYEIPCLVSYRIDKGHGPYLDWIGETTYRE